MCEREFEGICRGLCVCVCVCVCVREREREIEIEREREHVVKRWDDDVGGCVAYCCYVIVYVTPS